MGSGRLQVVLDYVHDVDGRQWEHLRSYVTESGSSQHSEDGRRLREARQAT